MDHTTLIDRILEVERTARSISDEALERQASQDTDLEAEKAALLDKYMARTQQRLEQLSRAEQEKMERSLAAQDARLAEAGQKIEQAYARYGDNWVDTLFRQVVAVQ